MENLRSYVFEVYTYIPGVHFRICKREWEILPTELYNHPIHNKVSNETHLIIKLVKHPIII